MHVYMLILPFLLMIRFLRQEWDPTIIARCPHQWLVLLPRASAGYSSTDIQRGDSSVEGIVGRLLAKLGTPGDDRLGCAPWMVPMVAM